MCAGKGEERGLGDSRQRVSVSTAESKVTVEKGRLILRHEGCTVLLAIAAKRGEHSRLRDQHVL